MDKGKKEESGALTPRRAHIFYAFAMETAGTWPLNGHKRLAGAPTPSQGNIPVSTFDHHSSRGNMVSFHSTMITE